MGDRRTASEAQHLEPVTDDLPFIDERTLVIAAPATDVWRTLTTHLAAWDNRATSAYVGVIGGSPPCGTGSFPQQGSAIPGFAVKDVEHTRRLVLAGRHRFSRYLLTFRLEPQGDRTVIRARSHAEFPGVPGRAYRAAVISSGAHRTLVRRMLRSVRRQATAEKRS